MAYDVEEGAMEPLVDGIIDLLKVNLIANTVLIEDAHIGDTVLHVDNAVRFRKYDSIIIMDNNATQDQFDTLTGVEFHSIATDFYDTNLITLKEPLKRDFLVSDNSRIQKTIKKTVLYEKDVLYGDRQIVAFDYVAICVEPNTLTEDWLAVRLLGTEFRLSIMVYAKCGGEADQEEYAMRVVSAYSDAIRKLLIGNIHLDVAIDEVPLVRDAEEGDLGVYVGCNIADQWTPDSMECHDVEVQDNFGAQQILKIVWPEPESSSSSLSSTSTLVLETSSSVSSVSSESSLASTETSNSSTSDSSWSSQSVSTTEGTSQSTNSSSISSYSSTSSMGGGPCFIALDKPLNKSFKMKDKAVLRRKKIYTYDSRVDNIEYGSTQKGSVLLKASKISWFGKQAEAHNFPQVGMGRQT